MNAKFTYALVLTVASAIFSLILFLTGFQTERLAVGRHLVWVMSAVHFAVLWLGIKAGREAAPDRSLSYGAGVGAGVLISLYSGLMSAVCVYIHFKFINPDFSDYQMELIRQKWTASGMSAAQMENAETMARKFLGPGISAAFTPIISVFFGTIYSLIIAAILKRPAAAQGEPPVVV